MATKFERSTVVTRRTEPPFVMIHVPKTAGTTLKEILRRHYPALHVRTGGNVVKSYEKALRETEKAGSALADDPTVIAVHAHVPFGFNRFFPADARYLTFLRDPIERAVSNHYHENRHRIADGEFSRLATPDEVRAGAALLPYLDNLQTRFLADVEHPFAVHATDELLEQAKASLRDRFTFVGITERFDESLLLLNGICGWPLTSYRKEKVATGDDQQGYGRRRPRVAELPPETVAVFEEHNRLDRELYAYGLQLFERRLAERRDEAFDRDLAVLRRSLALQPEADPSVEVSAERLRWQLELSDVQLEAGTTERRLRRRVDQLERRLGEQGLGVRAKRLPTSLGRLLDRRQRQRSRS